MRRRTSNIDATVAYIRYIYPCMSCEFLARFEQDLLPCKERARRTRTAMDCHLGRGSVPPCREPVSQTLAKSKDIHVVPLTTSAFVVCVLETLCRDDGFFSQLDTA